jgi:hypothetical protein
MHIINVYVETECKRCYCLKKCIIKIYAIAQDNICLGTMFRFAKVDWHLKNAYVTPIYLV